MVLANELFAVCLLHSIGLTLYIRNTTSFSDEYQHSKFFNQLDLYYSFDPFSGLYLKIK